MNLTRTLPQLCSLLLLLGISTVMTAQCVVTTISTPQSNGEIITIDSDNMSMLSSIDIVPSQVPNGTQYGYLITDASYTIQEVITSGAPLDLSAYDFDDGPIIIWGFNYTGNVLAMPGMSAFGRLSDGCFHISRNCIMIMFDGDPGNNGGDPCTAEAGMATVDDTDLDLDDDGNATITATADGNQVVPTGYETAFVLTMGSDLVIQDFNTSGSFDVSMSGDYAVHVFVAELDDTNSPNFEIGRAHV